MLILVHTDVKLLTKIDFTIHVLLRGESCQTRSYKLTNFCREKKVRHFVRQENIFKEFNIFYAKINTAESIF